MNGNMDAQHGPAFRRYLHGPFIDSLKLGPSSPHPPISSSSGSSSPHHDDVDSPPQPLPPSSVESPASYTYSSRSDDDAPTSPPSSHFGSKRRKQHKPIRCDGLKGDGLLDSDSGVHGDVSPATPHGEGSMEVQFEEGEVFREREFSHEMDGLRIEDGRGPSGPASSRGSSSPGGRRIPVMTGNRVFPVGPSGARIFNPDAYCQLCHREFCNKYFLKTHKANKHGVYDPDDASPPPPPPPPGPDLPDQMERDMLTSQIRLLCAQNLAIQQLLHRGPMFPMAPMFPMLPAFPPLPPPPEVQLEPSPAEGDGVVCGVCHKRLSSQSFLRIHLKRKHGLEEAGRGAPEGERKEKSRKRKGKRAELKVEAGENEAPRGTQSGLEGAEPAGSVHLQRLLLSIREPPGGCNIRRETFRCPACPTDFTSPYFLNCHLLKEHTHPPAPPTPEPAVLDLSVKAHPRPPPCPSPVPAASAPIDLESFCVKCNREYCSKYFLRTHLKKVHGMCQEEYLAEVQATRPEVWRSFVSGEGGPGAVEQPGVRRNWCKHCKKDFCNKYFFKTHMMKMHNEEVLDFQTNTRSSRRRSQSVSCDICHKDLCSKYFLKIHRRNAHKISDPSLPPEEGEGAVKDEEDMEDPSMPLSMAVSMAFQGPEGGGRDGGRASVITCVGTHFVPPPEAREGEEEGEEAEWDMVVKEELQDD